MPFTIYCHTNTVNGKKYVGQTQLTMEKRWAAHVHQARSKRGSRALMGAIRKYGSDAFTHEVLEVVATAEEADAAEKLWIEKLGCLAPGGYNLDGGGRATHDVHESTRALLSAATLKLHASRTPAERKAISEAARDTWLKNSTDRQRVLAAASVRMLAYMANIPPEQLSARMRKMWADMSPEKRREAALARSEGLKKSWAKRSDEDKAAHGKRIADWFASLSPEAREAIVQKRRATRWSKKPRKSTEPKTPLTHEQRSERSRKSWETRRINSDKAMVAGLPPRLRKKSTSRRARNLTHEQLSASTKKAWETRRSKSPTAGLDSTLKAQATKRERYGENAASFAGKKSWETRRANLGDDAGATQNKKMWAERRAKHGADVGRAATLKAWETRRQLAAERKAKYLYSIKPRKFRRLVCEIEAVEIDATSLGYGC